MKEYVIFFVIRLNGKSKDGSAALEKTWPVCGTLACMLAILMILLIKLATL